MIMKYLKPLWKKWLQIAKVIGNFNGQVILTIFYIILIAPLGIVYRFFADPLVIKKNSINKQKTNFSEWTHNEKNLESARRQY